MNRGTENHVVRLAEDPQAENILPPGNDGCVAPDGTTGDHYDDQLELFEEFEYKRLLFGDDEVDAATESTTELRRPSALVDDALPRDLDGDGRYEDINGDGEFTIQDVQLFFQNNPRFYNFNDSDPADVTIGDVQALFLDLVEE